MRKAVLSIVLVSLLLFSMFAFMTPVGSQANYTLIVDAAVEDTITSYGDGVELTPSQQQLQPIVVGMYLADTSQPGGIKKDTPNSYAGLDEGTVYDIKVPISAYKNISGNLWGVIFEHWEVWDQVGTPELEWVDGFQYRAVYTGSFPGGYTRITKLIADPKYMRSVRPEIEHNLEAKYQRAQKELLDIVDGVYGPPGILEPYLRFAVNNPVGGGDKMLIAVYHLSWGPETEHLYFRTIFGPNNQWTAFRNNRLDVLTDILQPRDINRLSAYGAIIPPARPGFHMTYFGFNLRLSWLGPQDGDEPGASLRRAMAHLLPKDTLIARLFRYIVVRLDTFVPPSLAEWYNPNVQIYDYDPVDAYNTLIAGGWEYSGTYGTWWHPATGVVAGGADALVQIMYTPVGAGHPFSSIITRYVASLNELSDPATGDPTPISAAGIPVVLSALITNVSVLHDFEVYLGEWEDIDIGTGPDFLYRFFHSSQDIPWGGNSPGIHNSALDKQLESVMFSLNHAAKVEATADAQVLLSDLLPYIPFYSRNTFNAHQPDYYGAVLSPGFGIDNFWTFVNIKGPRIDSDPWTPGIQQIFIPPLTQISGNVTIWTLSEAVESYNPASTSSVYAWTVLGNVYDGLIAMNPYTLQDKPWLAQSWQEVGPVNMTTPNGAIMVNGMYAEFVLDDRVVEGKVLWHDGEEFNASSIIFSWNYIWDNQLTNFYGFWEHLIDVHSPSPDRVIAYWNVTSQWLLYETSRTAALFAPQVWGYIDTDGDGLNYLDHGDIEEDLNIRAYTPETFARGALGTYPAANAFPWLTQVVGTGPYVLYSTTTGGVDSNLFAFDLRAHSTVMPTLHYWKSKAEIKEQKIEMFYHIGDISLDGAIDILDIARIGIEYGHIGTTYTDGTYRGFIQEDVNEDGKISILDLGTAGKNYGLEKEY